MLPNWMFNQSAVVPFIKESNEIKVVLITTNSSGKWTIPKGIVETPLSPEESAAKEAFEEAGVVGNVSSDCIAEYEYRKWGGHCRVKVFPMEVTRLMDRWEEMDVRERCIIGIPQAMVITKSELKPVLASFRSYMKQSKAFG